MSNFRAEFTKAESSQLRKDLVQAMDQTVKAKEKVDKLNKDLKVERKLLVQKDDKLQAAFLQSTSFRDKVINQFKGTEDFADLQFIQYFNGFELLHRWTLKHQCEAIDFSNLDFEVVDTEMLVDGEGKTAEVVVTITADRPKTY